MYGNDQARIDRELYLPEKWVNDVTRRADAHLLGRVVFATKGALAHAMLERAVESRLPFGWVTADSIYGGDYNVRKLLEDHACSDVLAVTSTHNVWCDLVLAHDLRLQYWGVSAKIGVV